MVPDGFADVDHQLALMLGEIKGQLASIIREFEDHRDQSRESAQAALSKMDHMEIDIISMKSTVPAIQSQVYSNKAEIDRTKTDVALIKAIFSRTMGVITVAISFVGLVITGVGWALSHWGEAAGLLKGVFWK